MNTPKRDFSINEAVRAQVPLLIGIVGPSGGGKTGSALELAHGIQEVVGGDIGAIDTEANRMLHYAGAPLFSDNTRKFKFKHLPFGAPFNPDSYMQAIQALVKSGVKTVIVDSMSHEHEGPGGVLEMHEQLLDKFSKGDEGQRDKNNFRAWAIPKTERRGLINFLLQQKVHFIFCFRAKEKLKLVPGAKPLNLGWQPIAGEEFVFEMTLNCLLLPGANGVPTWVPTEQAEKQMIKLPQQFKDIMASGRPLSAARGREMALWAMGGPVLEAHGKGTLPGGSLSLAPPTPKAQEASQAPKQAVPEVEQEMPGLPQVMGGIHEKRIKEAESLGALQLAWNGFNADHAKTPFSLEIVSKLEKLKNEKKQALSSTEGAR